MRLWVTRWILTTRLIVPAISTRHFHAGRKPGGSRMVRWYLGPCVSSPSPWGWMLPVGWRSPPPWIGAGIVRRPWAFLAPRPRLENCWG